jgi:transposase
MVGSYLGLQPKQSQSGDSSPQLGITKSGNGFLRRMLVGSRFCSCQSLQEPQSSTAFNELVATGSISIS